MYSVDYLQRNGRKCPSPILMRFEYVVEHQKVLDPNFFRCLSQYLRIETIA